MTGEQFETETKADHEKRKVPRFALVRPVEVTEKGSGLREYGQLAEISRKGCFIDIAKTLPLGTPISIDIAIDPGVFKTDGVVIYTKAATGMGIGFKETSAEQLAILDTWLGANVSRCFFRPNQG